MWDKIEGLEDGEWIVVSIMKITVLMVFNGSY